MRKVGIHYNHKVASTEVEPMDICSPAHELKTHSFFILTPSTYPSPSFPARGLRSLTDNEPNLDVESNCTYYFVLAISPRQLNGYFLCPIRTRIVYDDDLP